MTTQLGLKREDVFAIISEDKTEVSIHVGIPECEKFTIIKQYSSLKEYTSNIQNDIDAFISSHSQTPFIVGSLLNEETLPEPEDPVLNDSWSAIFNDAKDGVKARFRR